MDRDVRADAGGIVDVAARGAKGVMREEGAGEAGRAFRVCSVDGKRRRPAGGDEESGGRGRRPDAAEPAAPRAAQIEHAEVEARRRFDEDGAGPAHGVAGSRRDRM